MKTEIMDPLFTATHTQTLPVVPTPESPSDTGMVLMIERLAANPNVDVEKLERLIAMQERILKHDAKAAFDSAFARMQPDIPEISEQGQIVVKGVLRSTYAKLEDIVKVIKPILKDHGFALRHRTEWPLDKPGIIRIVGILSHAQGHSEESSFEAPADKSDYRTEIQSQGSTVSYGRRYTTSDLLNITTRGQDKDGQGKREEPPNPDGYDPWLAALTSVADNGWTAFDHAWQISDIKFRNYLSGHAAITLASLKTRARKAGR